MLRRLMRVAGLSVLLLSALAAALGAWARQQPPLTVVAIVEPTAQHDLTWFDPLRGLRLPLHTGHNQHQWVARSPDGVWVASVVIGAPLEADARYTSTTLYAYNTRTGARHTLARPHRIPPSYTWIQWEADGRHVWTRVFDSNDASLLLLMRYDLYQGQPVAYRVLPHINITTDAAAQVMCVPSHNPVLVRCMNYARRVHYTFDGATSALPSPDGQWLLMNADIYALGDTAARHGTLPLHPIHSLVRWSHDSRRLLYTNAAREVVTYDVTTGHTEVIFRGTDALYADAYGFQHNSHRVWLFVRDRTLRGTYVLAHDGALIPITDAPLAAIAW